MTARRAVLVALAVGVAGTVGGCLDALAPARAPRVATVGLTPLFGGVANNDGIPADVDSIVVTIHNPPAPDTAISQRILPGQDSIVITIDVPITGSNVDTVQMSLEAIRTGPPVEVLYRADSVPLIVRVGQPTRADTIRADYVGPGAGTLRAITITPRSVVLRPGDSLAFAFTAIDSAGASCCSTMPILWNSRTEGVAHVSARGVVAARSNGQAWIVATSGASAAIKDSVEIVVATGPVALISFGPSAATFTASAGQANPAPQVVTVTNGGAGTLSNITFTGIQYTSGQPAGWLAATLAGPAAPTTLTLTATTGTLPPGTYTAAVSLASPQASNSPLALPVTFTVNPVPTIGFTPATVTVVDTLTTTDPSPSTVSVTNIGTGTLSGLAVGTISYGASQPTGWLTASLGGTTAPATLTLTFAKGTLPAGVYTATVPITSPVAVNSPRNLSVTFDVRPLAMIALTPTALSFIDTVTTTDPGSKTVAITNVGTGTLGGLAVGTVTYGAGQPTGWLTASLSGTTAPATLTVTVAKDSLVPGVYTATIPVASAAAGNSPQSVAVTFDVRPLPMIALTPTALSFIDTLTTTDPASKTVAIANVGTGTLGGLAVGTVTYGAGQQTGWLTASLSGTTAPATLTVNVAKDTLPVGVYTATIPITSAAAANSPQTVSVSLDVRPGPAIGLSAASATFTDTVLTTDPASQTVSITNTSGGTLSGLALGTVTYGAGQPIDWLTAALSGATAPATITLSVAKGSLVPGTYTATISVTSTVASNSPQLVAVTFTLQPPPLAALKVTPGFGVVIPTGTLALTTTGYNSVGGTVPAAGLRYLSRSTAVATVDSITGTVTGVVGGTAVVVATAPGAAGPVSDSTLVAVAASGVAVAMPVAGGRAFGAAKVGDTVVVRVLVDLHGVPAEKLGSYNAQLNWVPATLRYVRSTAVAGGFAAPTLNEAATATGQLRFGAADAAGTAGPTIGILDITFVADAGGTSALTFALTDLSASSPSYIQMLPPAMVLSGGVRVQ